MRRYLLSLLVLLSLWATSPAARAGTLKLKPLPIGEAVQDAAGTVWVTTPHDRRYDRALHRWHNNDWQAVRLAEPGDNAAFALARGSQGTAICLWLSDSIWFLTEHTVEKNRKIARLEVKLSDPRIFQDSSGAIWLTDSGASIYRIVPKSGETVVVREPAYTVGEEQSSMVHPDEGRSTSSLGLRAVEDSQGRIWFWSAIGYRTTRRALRGALLYEKNAFVHHPQLKGIPDTSLSLIVPTGAGRMWVVAPEVGLFEVESTTLTATPVEVPFLENGRFPQIQSIVPAGKSTYFVVGNSGGRYSDNIEVPEAQMTAGALWRHDGGWGKLLPGLDAEGRTTDPARGERAWLSTEEGDWIGSTGGLIFRPAQGVATLIDWKHGYPLRTANYLFKLKDGRLLAIAKRDGSTVFNGSGELLDTMPSPRVRVIKTRLPPRADKRGHIWTVFPEKPSLLQEWDGETWHSHELPATFVEENLWELLIDNRGRIWVVSLQGDLAGLAGRQITVLFNPADKTWSHFETLQAALVAQLGTGLIFDPLPNKVPVPVLGAQGRIYFSTHAGELNFYDGQLWRRWAKQQFTENTRGEGTTAFLNDSGKFVISGKRISWQWDETAGWSRVPFQPVPGMPDSTQPPQPNPTALYGLYFPTPPGSIDGASAEGFRLEGIVATRDENGAHWLALPGQLHKAWGKQLASWFEPGENHPFLARRTFDFVLPDKRGNVFLGMRYDSKNVYLQIKAPAPPPPVTMQSVVRDAGIVALEFTPPLPPGAQLVWRLGDAPWSEPTRQSHIELGAFSSGRYRIQAMVMGHDLQFSSVPLEVNLEVKVDPTVQIAALITQLHSPNYGARHDAVESLARQAKLALPALRAAREKLLDDKDKLWWVDAAIQQVEERKP